LVHFGTFIGKAGGEKRRDANSTRVEAFYTTLARDVLIRKWESINAQKAIDAY
jgi:hypothetical protein